ncbi:MAG: hypothetical protein WDZ86_00030, partial [Gammaproteobacteria bacterium]
MNNNRTNSPAEAGSYRGKCGFFGFQEQNPTFVGAWLARRMVAKQIRLLKQAPTEGNVVFLDSRNKTQ